MAYPNFNEEKKLWRRGFEVVVGLDEAGRGPLAGPVVAGAITIRLAGKKHSDILQNMRMFSGVRDSKKLSEKQREELYELLTNHEDVSWGVGVVSEKVIDKINVLEATKLAMQKAYSNVLENIGIGFLLIDGNFKIDSPFPQKSVIKGDQKVFSIAAASIIAKVTRDRIMQTMHKKYPGYGFDRHKGYGTVAHLVGIQKLGPCKIHRKTFWPVSSLAKKGDI